MSVIALPGRPLHLSRFLPFLRWWPRVNGSTVRADAIAGLVGAILVLPQGVAFAIIAGMPPEYGLYAGMIPAVIAALFGSSWHLVSGPTTAASILLYAVLSLHASPGSSEYVQLAITLTFLVGVIELGMGLLRFGSLVNFIPHAVVVGFTAGAALLILSNQLPTFLGLVMPRSENFAATIHDVVAHLAESNLYVVQVSLLTLTVGVAIKHFRPRWPYMLIALVVGTLFAVLLERLMTPQTTGIALVGYVRAGLPPLSAPVLNPAALLDLLPAALAVTLLALTEAVSIARAVAVRSGQSIDGNQEFIGQGLSNLLGSFFSAYVATGSFNRTGLNEAAGAKTPLAAVFGGIILLLLAPTVLPLAAYIPKAVIAAILFQVAWGLIDFHHIGQLRKSYPREGFILLVTFLATLFIDMEKAILAGVMLSLIFHLRRTSQPELVSLVPDRGVARRSMVRAGQREECPQLKVARLDGSLYFGAVAHVEAQLEEVAQKHLIIVASGINLVDSAGSHLLIQEAKRRQAAGGDLYLVDVKRGPGESLQRGGLSEVVPQAHLFPGKESAIASVFPRLDAAICRSCKVRLFRECQTVAGDDTGKGEK
ncbi:MAG: sulfate permease [Magnetococcales bacterium]|nr:sulfate permease [Magnetococcales bacterium]